MFHKLLQPNFLSPKNVRSDFVESSDSETESETSLVSSEDDENETFRKRPRFDSFDSHRLTSRSRNKAKLLKTTLGTSEDFESTGNRILMQLLRSPGYKKSQVK